MLYATSKSDVCRLEAVQRFTGIAQGAVAGARLLDATNAIWRTNTIPSRFISDSMVAIWMTNPVLHGDLAGLLSEGNQYELLAWYCCMRPLESGCRLSSEPVDPILHRMAREAVSESPHGPLPYTALMISIYHFRRDVRAAVSLRGGDSRPNFLGWYYCHGIRELGIIHHVADEERELLNAVPDDREPDGISPLCRFALEWLPHPDFDLSSREDRAIAWAWFAQSASLVEPFATLADGRLPASALPGESHPAEPGGGSGDWLPRHSEAGSPRRDDDAAAADHDAKYRVEWRIAEYFDRRGSGERLLFAGEWYPAEDRVCWSHSPFASLLFRLPAPIANVVDIGVLLYAAEDAALLSDRELTIFLNGRAVWNGLLREATKSELIFTVAADDIRAGACNLLQFHLSEPFVLAELMANSDSRDLGVALRRLWIGPTQRRQRNATAARRRAGPLAAPTGERLLVLRGDLRSQTGYGKATRALAELVPGHFRTIGVDIHPDPADNQAVAAFAIVPEAEALKQVAEHPNRCAVLHATAPDDFAIWPNARNVGWFFWETDTVPFRREWPLRLALMDAIWAPSTFMAEFVRSARYRGPVHSVAWPEDFAAGREPTAAAPDLPVSYFDELADLRQPQRACLLSELRREARLLFLAVQSLAARKGLPLLLSEWRSHVEASGGSDILVLRLAFRHLSGAGEADWRDLFLDALAVAGFRPGGRVRIAVIPMAVSEAALAGLYRTADGFLSMSFGEGFGGPVAEAIQQDCPVIVPRHTGLRDLIPADYPLAISSRRLAVGLKGNLPAYPYSATWHIPEAGALRDKLGEFAAMSPPARQLLVRQCRRYAMSFCWTPVVRQNLAAALDDLDLDGSGDNTQPAALGVAATDTGRHAAD